jgi:hypothetical protein
VRRFRLPENIEPNVSIISVDFKNIWKEVAVTQSRCRTDICSSVLKKSTKT